MPRPKNQKFTHPRTKEELSAKEWAERIGISVPAFYKRLEDPNWTLEDALTRPPSNRKPNRLTPQLITTICQRYAAGETVTALAKAYGVQRNTVYRAIKLGEAE